ncbi:MAG: hypothetical protein ABIQ52_17485 [Vicinamibacterales bacterium]
MRVPRWLWTCPLALALLVMAAGCGKGTGVPEIKQPGIFTESGGDLVEMRKLGTLGTTYGPRLYPDLPEYDIPVVSDVGRMYVNIPNFTISSLKAIEWHGYRLGGNGSAGTPSTATPQDWKSVAITSEPTTMAGVYRVVVAAADARTGRWKPESNHEYFGLTVDGGYKGGPIWAVKIR